MIVMLTFIWVQALRVSLDRSGLAKEIKVSGFEKVRYEALTFSVVALHQGWKKIEISF